MTRFRNRLMLAGAALAALATAAPAAAALDLSTYTVSLQRGLDIAEASGVAYNYDRNSLLVVGDEGDVANEFALDGTKLSTGAFQSTFRDAEGITYIGNGQYVLADERREAMAKIQAVSTTTTNGATSVVYTGTNQAQTYLVNGGTNVGNNGLEGVAFDPLTGGYFGVKQGGAPGVAERVYFTTIAFGSTTTGTTSLAFDPAPLGLATLSDIAVLASNPNFAGTDYYGNLLLLSADASTRRLIEVTRSGALVSSFDLSSLAIQVIEGVSLDHSGNIYLVGELGGVSPSGTTSGLVVLSRASSAVPEPASWAMMIGGFGLVGAAMRRRQPATLRTI
ncbi:SdiA-regulated domain-containing protein [Sphingomonas sp. BIUV-7]|uniref:SdiA-regulated domain-containing protein n=1 Tax=Sphingomonas natans TaxID=3063330 RepID=A0ABT8Y6A6_9SPHN|nr:SdiA-regulated domain-containing protein [Sphingomonas sp. BIUV-7]MDO6413205.1 SdiA-regulated domain-containing protein [Sphingomonas sp. BIUV-7]